VDLSYIETQQQWSSKQVSHQDPSGRSRLYMAPLKKSASMASLQLVEKSYESFSPDSTTLYMESPLPLPSRDTAYLRHVRSSTENFFSDSSDCSNGSTICRYFAQGYCSRGSRCHYAHIPSSGHVTHTRNHSVPVGLVPYTSPTTTTSRVTHPPFLVLGPPQIAGTKARQNIQAQTLLKLRLKDDDCRD
jgi:hypothetical protein